MTTVPKILLASALVAGGFAAGRLASGRRAAAPAREVLYYVDPMHPAYRSDHPGTAPDCGMALEPVYAGGGPAAPAGGPPRPAGTVTIPGALRQLQGIRVAAVERAATAQTLRLFGRVVPDETRVYALNAAMEGSIRRLSDVTAGTLVKKGQWLGAFFSADIRTPLQAYVTALDVVDRDPLYRGERVQAGTNAGRSARFAAERLHGMGMSWNQIEEMHRKREIPLTVDILAPADGLVLARGISLGQKFDKGAEWFRVADLERVWVLADLLEADLPLVRPGARAAVVVPGRAAPLEATVSAVPPAFDAASRTRKLRLELPNPGAALRPDMFVDVELAVERPAAVTVPADAVVDTGLRRTVFIEAGEGQLEPRAVETGWRAGGRVEVLRGLSPGERIVVSGTFLVDSESQIRSAAAGIHGAPARDPVCGMEVDEARAAAGGLTHAHGGRTWSFCSETCRSRFRESPERYAAAPVGAAGHVAVHAGEAR